MPINVDTKEKPPQKVMQTAVVGRNGSLTYRLNLDGFPGFGWAVTYFAEIEDLGPSETRKFKLVLPGSLDLSKLVVNIQENAQGKYRLYEPGVTNISLPFVLSFRFAKTIDSSDGPLLNAMEINKYLQKNDGSPDGARVLGSFLNIFRWFICFKCVPLVNIFQFRGLTSNGVSADSRFACVAEVVIANIVAQYSSKDWAQEGGDPCLPVPWSWADCNSDPQPRIISM